MTTGRDPDDAANGSDPRHSPPGLPTEWQVSVPVPHDAAPEDVDAVIRYLGYLGARRDTIGERQAITLIVRTDTLDKARHYALQRVLALIDGKPEPWHVDESPHS